MRFARKVPPTLIIAAVVLLACSVAAFAQFEGNSIKIKGKPICEGFRYAKDTAVVWNGDGFGVFAVSWNRREIYFIRVTDAGKKKGTVKMAFVGTSSSITAIDALWNGDNYVLAFNYFHSVNGDAQQYVHLLEVSPLGKALGDPVVLDDTRAAMHFAFAWNGSSYGVAYWQYLISNSAKSPLYFQRYGRDFSPVGKRKLLMRKDGIVDIGVASSKQEFGVAWRSDIGSEWGTAYLARFRSTGKKAGKNKTFKRPVRIYHMRLISNGTGYALSFARGDDQEYVELFLFNNILRTLKGPIEVNQDGADDHFHPCVALLDGTYWVFWESSMGWMAPADETWGVTAGKVDSGGTVLVTDHLITQATTTLQEYPRCAAAGSKGVLLAYHRFVPNNWTADQGELWLRFMPK